MLQYSIDIYNKLLRSSVNSYDAVITWNMSQYFKFLTLKRKKLCISIIMCNFGMFSGDNVIIFTN